MLLAILLLSSAVAARILDGPAEGSREETRSIHWGRRGVGKPSLWLSHGDSLLFSCTNRGIIVYEVDEEQFGSCSISPFSHSANVILDCSWSLRRVELRMEGSSPRFFLGVLPRHTKHGECAQKRFALFVHPDSDYSEEDSAVAEDHLLHPRNRYFSGGQYQSIKLGGLESGFVPLPIRHGHINSAEETKRLQAPVDVLFLDEKREEGMLAFPAVPSSSPLSSRLPSTFAVSMCLLSLLTLLPS